MDLKDLAELIRYVKLVEHNEPPEKIPKIDFGKHEWVREVITPLMGKPFIEDRLNQLADIKIEWVRELIKKRKMRPIGKSRK